jgi:hypothetical protein
MEWLERQGLLDNVEMMLVELHKVKQECRGLEELCCGLLRPDITRKAAFKQLLER